MKKQLKIILLASHLALFGAGVGLGIYILPILTAQENATIAEIEEVQKVAKYSGEFKKDQKGSDALHWANGQLFVTDNEIVSVTKSCPFAQ